MLKFALKTLPNRHFLSSPLKIQQFPNYYSSSGIQTNISPLQLKKRTVRKRKQFEQELQPNSGLYNVVAYATAEEYNLEHLKQGLFQQDLYKVEKVEGNPDVVYAIAKYPVDRETREIFFFREGSLVLWNCNDAESGNLLNFLQKYELESYSENIVNEECEIMNYKYQPNSSSSQLENTGSFLLNPQTDTLVLDKYTFSNAMVLSVKLGIWEASLENFVDTIEFVTEDLKCGNKIRMTREQVLRKHGELFALRHMINLSSDLLDTPDFYWDNERLEKLYLQVCHYFNITKRTKVVNDKINHCVELIELLSTHLSDKHHIRLEWMIIVLIMVEVGFETIHYAERFIT